MTGILYGIGVGPGDPELITVKAINTIKNSDIIAVPKASGDDRVALNIAKQAVPELEEKEILELDMPMTRDKELLAKSHQNAAEAIVELLKEGKNVAFLTLGDPAIYSTYMYVHERVMDMNYPVSMVPGVPSFCAVAARLNISLTKASQALHIIPASYKGVDHELDQTGTKILMKSGKSIGAVKAKLQERGLSKNAMMVQRCGMEGEQVYRNMDEADENSSYFSTIVVKEMED